MLLHEHYPVDLLRQVLGVPRSGFHYKDRTTEERPIREALIEAAGQWHIY